LYAEGKLTKQPFDEPVEYLYFNMWHYDGRTAKHGAFMGGADFVQWHGNYELVSKLSELKHAAAELGLKSAPGKSPTPNSGALAPVPANPAAAPTGSAKAAPLHE
jgi:hypothetical protein